MEFLADGADFGVDPRDEVADALLVDWMGDTGVAE